LNPYTGPNTLLTIYREEDKNNYYIELNYEHSKL